MVEGLRLLVEKIDCCERGCMIYWSVDSALRFCKLCGHPRYKSRRRESTKHKGDVLYKRMYYFPLIPRLQRLYASKAIAKDMC